MQIKRTFQFTSSLTSRRQPARGGAVFVLAVLTLLLGLVCSAPVNAGPPSAKNAKSAKTTYPPLGPGKSVGDGVTFYDTTLVRAGVPMRIWTYIPASATQAKKAPVILIAPAGTRLFHGNDFGESGGDHPEHLPWARAGYIVVAYELDGPLNAKTPSDSEIIHALRLFMRAGGGIANARAAMGFAAARVPQADMSRVYTAGHSSAATLALQVAQAEPKRIKACIAFAPCTDIEGHLSEAMHDLDKAVPGFRSFVAKTSPINHPEKLTCPTFLFHADDDTNVELSDNATFASVVGSTNKRLTFVRVPTGNHYESMISQGIPQAIAWLNAQQ